MSFLKGKFLLELEPININLKVKGNSTSKKNLLIHPASTIVYEILKSVFPPHPGGILTQLTNVGFRLKSLDF